VLATPRSRDFGPLPPEVDAPFRAALSSIERDLGLPVEEIPPGELFPGGGDSAEDWYVTVTVEELHWLGREWVVANLDRFGAAFRGEMEGALGYTVDDYLGARLRRFGYVLDLDRLLGDDAVLVCPTNGEQGWLADGTVPSTGRVAGAEGYNTGEFNLSGHPALSVPTGVSANGLPFGLEIVGPRWRDDLVLELAAAWEGAHSWQTTAPGYPPFGEGLVR
jgi:Asp-tRNA(Asn)/Glu-tRNA(Gln) amidotransferase A subunit family amidase